MKSVILLYLSLMASLMGQSVIVYAQSYVVKESGVQEALESPEKGHFVPVYAGTPAVICKPGDCRPKAKKQKKKGYLLVKVKDAHGIEHVVLMQASALQSSSQPLASQPEAAKASTLSQVVNDVDCSYCKGAADKLKSHIKSITEKTYASGFFNFDCSDASLFNHTSLIKFENTSSQVDNYYLLNDGTSSPLNIPVTENQHQPSPLCFLHLNGCVDQKANPTPQRDLARSFNTAKLFKAVRDCKFKSSILPCQQSRHIEDICSKKESKLKSYQQRKCQACWDAADQDEGLCSNEKNALERASDFCMAATEQYYIGCDETSHLPNSDLRDEVFKRVDFALGDFKVSSTDNPPSISLTPSLTQCLITKEDHDYQTMRMNSTECKSGISSAVGLFQMTGTFMEAFGDPSSLRAENFVGLCGQFQKLFKGKKDSCQDQPVSTLHDKMHVDRDLQIAIGLRGLDFDLKAAKDNVKKALMKWYGGKEKYKFADEVISCQQCLNSMKAKPGDTEYNSQFECCLNEVDNKKCKADQSKPTKRSS